jgi:outer membrane protein assembly factor BamB
MGEDCVYARLGAQKIQFGEGAAPESLLVSLATQSTAAKRLRWQVRPPDAAVFEGAPVTRAGLVWIAATRASNGRAITSILCYSDNTATSKPALLWQQDIVSAADSVIGPGRTRHQLLTLAGADVVYCSHTGVVAALDAATGMRRWAQRYQGQRGATESIRDLAPCLAVDGRIYVAPGDADLLLCLDQATGRMLWEQPRSGVLHLLGVGEGRLIFTTATGLVAIDAADGSSGIGWELPNVGGRLTTVGRGLLVGNQVLWPTQRGVLAVRQRDGRQENDPSLLHNIPAGNLVYHKGVLLVADREILTVFLPSPSGRN